MTLPVELRLPRVRRVAFGAMLLVVVSMAMAPGVARAFSFASPICEVAQLPLLEMSSTLSNPPPSGWTVNASQPAFEAGGTLTLQVRNIDPQRRARGIVIWTKSGSTTGFGRFAIPANDLFQYVPPPAFCQQWSLTHTNGLPKDQADLRFAWTAPLESPAGAVIARAFIIEDCVPDPKAGCRSYQAITPFLLMPEAMFLDGFEDGSPVALD